MFPVSLKIIKNFLFYLLLLIAIPASAQEVAPRISIIIDDLGNDINAGSRVAKLPGAIECAILPSVQFSVALATQCHLQGKEVILHLPMQALQPHRLGPGGLYKAMSMADFLATLHTDIAAVPFLAGINNHEGSLITASALQMVWLMQALKLQDLFFVDSVTTAHSVAKNAATAQGVPIIQRDVFLDDVPTRAAIQEQLESLLDRADAKGQAIAIGHPYPATLAVLEEELPRLAGEGYRLVPVSELLLEQPITLLGLHLKYLDRFWQQFRGVAQ